MIDYRNSVCTLSPKFFCHFYLELRETVVAEFLDKIQNREITEKSFIKRMKRMWKKYKFDFITYADFF
jgi:hypothetical protein